MKNIVSPDEKIIIKLERRIEMLETVIRKVLRLEPLWMPSTKDKISCEYEGEMMALLSMKKRLKEALFV